MNMHLVIYFTSKFHEWGHGVTANQKRMKSLWKAVKNKELDTLKKKNPNINMNDK